LRPSATGVETEPENRTKTIAVHGEALAARELAQGSHAMMAHPLALEPRNLQTPGRAPSQQELHRRLPGALMGTIGELGAS
jgi:hypothetical protein